MIVIGCRQTHKQMHALNSYIGTLQTLCHESINVFIMETSNNEPQEFLRGS